MKKMYAIVALLLLLALGLWACGGGGDAPSGDSDPALGDSDTTAGNRDTSGGDSDADSTSGSDPAATDSPDTVGPPGGTDAPPSTDPVENTFRLGANMGFRNASWDDVITATLSAQAGCDSLRLSLPERHLDRWGYDVEVSDMQAYAQLGFRDAVGFLTEPIRAHSTAPASVPDGDLVRFAPAGLYEPVLLDDGSINPQNHWGAYVYNTVRTYHPWIKVWEIWNEPDYTDNWPDTLTWTEVPPTAAQLPRFNGDIYAYIRMLRVSKEAARLADPEALIATGGIGYASFLDALTRYTDNPLDGSATEQYPQKGGAYFDVLSFHHYPIYTPGNSDAGVRSYLSQLAELRAVLDKAGVSVARVETTETGAPRFALGGYPGGDAYAAHYLAKVMVAARQAGVHGIDWFALNDSAALGESQFPYDYMGLYYDILGLDDPADARLSPSGEALRTLSRWWAGWSYDALGTEALLASFAAEYRVQGAAFSRPGDGRAMWVLWVADPDEAREDLSLSVPLGAGGNADIVFIDGETLAGEDVVLAGPPWILPLHSAPSRFIAAH